MKINALKDGRWEFDSGEIGGVRVRKTLNTRAEAEALMRSAKEKRKKYGEELLMKWLALTTGEIQQILDYRHAVIQINGKPDWEKGKELHVHHLTATIKGAMLEQLLVEYIQRKRKAGRNTDYVDRLERELGAFVQTYPKHKASDITDKNIDSFLDERGLEGITRSNRIRDIRAFFGFAVRRGHCSINPADLTEAIKIVRKRNKAFTVQEVAVILWVSEHHPEWELTSYIGFNIWGSSRVAESFRLDWNEYIKEESALVFEAAATKPNQERVTENLPPVLEHWIHPYIKDSGPLSPPESTVEWRRSHYLVPSVQKILSQFKWLKNGLRKTSISAEYALTNDAKAVAAKHGTSPEMLFKNYRAVIRKTEAPKYYDLTRNNIIKYLEGLVPEPEMATWMHKYPQHAIT